MKVVMYTMLLSASIGFLVLFEFQIRNHVSHVALSQKNLK